MRLAEVLRQRLEPVRLEGGFGERSPITVHLDGRISVRNREAAFKGQMYAANAGDIVFSKIDARNGAIGVLPPSISAAVVTPEFPVFTPAPERLDSGYLEAVLRTGGFIDALRRRATGTSGRKRITADAFRGLAIPLPPLDEQRALVAAHARMLAQADAEEAAAAVAETDARAAFAGALGLAAPPPLPDRPVFIARFRDLDRWSHEAALRRASGGDAGGARWPVMRLGDVIADLENRWSPKCLDRPAQGDEWGVLKLGAVSFGVFDEGQNKALPPSLTPRPSLEITPGQVLISRANVTRLVGATAFVEATKPRLLLCDKIFRCVFGSESRVDPAFVAEVLRTKPLRDQIEAAVTGTSPTMKNISKPALLALAFPLPPLATQRTLVAGLAAAGDEAAAGRAEAARLRRSAREAFEAAVFT